MSSSSSLLAAKMIRNAMSRVAPLRFAEKWDNVGLLLESPVEQLRTKHRVLLTIDLTTQVTDEALSGSEPPAMIVSYHPPLFKPTSSFTLANPLQKSLLRLASAGVSVYSPHSALDSIHGGVNDWIASAFGEDVSITYFNTPEKDLRSRVPDSNGIQGYPGGRLATLKTKITLEQAVAAVKKHFGLRQVQIGYAVGSTGLGCTIQTVAICAGSGGSEILGTEADLYLTGEMSHHEVLAATAAGHHVILCGHTNTERGYLSTLANSLRTELSGNAEGISFDIGISEADKHPLDFV